MPNMRQVVDLTFPDGPEWQPKPDGQYDGYREAMADIFDFIREDVISLAHLRDPDTTPLLDDLENDYGKTANENLSEETRKALLDAIRYKKKTNATDQDLQRELEIAGFDLQVYQNSPDGPAVDPNIFLDQNFQMQAGDQTNDYAGQDEAYAGRAGGLYLVNGETSTQRPAYFGAGDVYAGNDKAVAGYFEYLFHEPIVYPISTDPDDWPFVFFVGGDATFDPVTGEILTIEQGLVPAEQKQRLLDIIFKYKPLFTSCALIVTFT